MAVFSLAFWLPVATADVAFPGDGGGTTEDPTPPPGQSPTPPSINPEARDTVETFAEDLSDPGLVGIDFEILSDPGASEADQEAAQTFEDLRTVSTTVDESAATHEPGSGSTGELLNRINDMEQQLAEFEAATLNSDAYDSLSAEEKANLDNLVTDLEQKIAVATEIIQLTDAAVRNSDANIGIDVSRGALSKMALSRRSSRGGASAGGFLEDSQFSLDTSWARFDDDAADGDGDDYEYGFTYSGYIGDRWNLGISARRNVYELSGPFDLDRKTHSLDFFTSYDFTDWFSLGWYLNYGHTDIDGSVAVPLVGTISIDDSYSRWASGLTASFSKAVNDQMQFGLTTSVSSNNKDDLENIFDSNDSSWATLIDCYSQWTDNFSTSVYGTFYNVLEMEDDIGVDRSFWFVGVDATYYFNDQWSVNVGYETMLGYKDYDEDRVNLSITYAF
jgi:hypothetical protein